MIYIITCALIAFDFITGIIKALATQTFTTTKMREGLFHKAGLALCIVLGVLLDYAQGYVDIGVTIPVATAICGYISLMEASSSVENLCGINPDITPDKLTALFGNKIED